MPEMYALGMFTFEPIHCLLSSHSYNNIKPVIDYFQPF